MMLSGLLRLIGFILALQAFTFVVSASSFDDEWEAFKIRFNKVYGTFDEEAKRFEIYRDNCRKFEEHNKQFNQGNVTFKMNVNRDADMTYEEIHEKFKMKPVLVLILHSSGLIREFCDDIKQLCNCLF